MSDTNTPNDESRNAAPSGAGDNPPAQDAQPTTPLTPAPATPDAQDAQHTTPLTPSPAPQDAQDFQATTPQQSVAPQAPTGRQAPQVPQAPQMPQTAQQPGGPQQVFQPGAPQQPFQPGAPQGPGAPQAPGVPSYGYSTAPKQPKGLAITALVLGIVAVVGGMIFGWIPFVGGIITVLCGLAALILGFIAIGKKQSKGMSITGLILGGVGVLAGIGIIIAWSFIFANVNKEIENYSSSLDELQSELDSYDYETDTGSGFSESDPGVDSLEYSAAFCSVFNEYLALNPSGDLASDSPEALDVFQRLAAEESPNQDVYQLFYDIISDPANATNYGYDEIEQASQDLVSAMMDDTAACM